LSVGLPAKSRPTRPSRRPAVVRPLHDPLALILEAKKHIKERLTYSPDLGDAAALTFAVDLSTVKQSLDLWSRPHPTPGGWIAV
jgi:hypothetical protein